MKLSCDLPATKERADDFNRFYRACAERGIKVGVQNVPAYDAKLGRTVPYLRVTCRTVVETRDPLNIGELVVGDIRETTRLLALKIGFRPKIV